MSHVLFRAKNFLFLSLSLGCFALPATGFAKFYNVYINSNPSGANVYLNGNLKGQTSPDSLMRLWGGTYDIRLELPGYKTLEKKISLTKNKEHFSYTLEPAAATLDIIIPGIDKSAEGAEVFVDGESKGSASSIKGLEVTSGKHLIEAKSLKKGFRNFLKEFVFKAGEPTKITLTLEPDTSVPALPPPEEKHTQALLTVIVPIDDSSSRDAQVYINGNPIKRAPFVKFPVEPGTSLVEIKKEGFKTFSEERELKAGVETRVVLHLEPEKKDDKTVASEKKGALSLIVKANGQNVNNGKVVIDKVNTFAINDAIPLSLGIHVIEVIVDGYQSETRNVMIRAGDEPTPILVELRPVIVDNTGTIRVILGRPIANAQYFINGSLVEANQILSIQGVKTAPGRVTINIQKPGWGNITREIQNLAPGKTEVIQVESGSLLVQSDQDPADVWVDGVPLGQTGQSFDMAVGPHRMEVRKPGFQAYQTQVEVKVGQIDPIQVKLQTAPLDAESARFAASTYGAPTLPPGVVSFSFGTGFPYYGNAKLDVGAFRKGMFGIDAGVEFRTTGFEHDVGANVRFQFLKVKEFFGIGAHMYIGGGAGQRLRNSFNFELGVPITISAGKYVKFTFSPYIQAYSDRLCPDEGTIKELASKNAWLDIEALGDPVLAAEHGSDRCVGLGNGGNQSPVYAVAGFTGFANNGQPMVTTPNYRDGSNQVQPQFLVDGNPVLDRFSGVRGMLRGIVEINATSRWTLTGILEGAPVQRERQMFTNKFNFLFPQNDSPRLYGRFLATYKFN